MAASKTRSTWGAIRKRGVNSWEISYTKGSKRASETIRGTRKDAERKLAELRIKYEGMRKDITLSEFWDTCYYPHIKEHLAASTVPGYERVWRVDIEPAFGDFCLSDITPRKIQAWLDPMTGGKAKHAKAVLSAILSRAFALELIDDNPAQRRFVMPKGRAPGQRSKDIYSKEELDQILALCHGEPWEGAFILSAFGGASREEAMGVLVNEIQFVTGAAIVPIVRGVQRLDGEVKVLDWTKTEHRQRDLVILEPYATRLHQIVETAKTCGDVWLTDDGFGNPLCPNTMANRQYKDWFGRQPIRYIPFSNLRHAYATYTSGKVDPMMLAKLMGHSQPTTTYNNYYRPSTIDKINALNGN